MKYSGKMLGMGHKIAVSAWWNWFLTAAEALLLLRVFLKFFFTTADSGFVHWAYNTTDVLLSPLRGMFSNPTQTPTNWYVDFVALFAMAAYPTLAALLISLVGWANRGVKR